MESQAREADADDAEQREGCDDVAVRHPGPYWWTRFKPIRCTHFSTLNIGGMGGFPGYYTLDTTQGGRTVGMLSVNAATGAIWYHTWHGRFLAERDF